MRILRALAVLLSVAFVGACAADTGTPGPVGGGGEPLTCDSGSSYFYVLDRIAVPADDGSGMVSGFDLDARVSDAGDSSSCGHGDFTSPVTGEPGVDNQFAVLATALASSFDINGSLGSAIAEGTLTMVVEVANVDDLANDNCVNVTVSLGYPSDGSTMIPPEAGRQYDTRELARVAGHITNGRLETETLRVESAITLVDPPVPFVIENAKVEMDLSPTGVADGVIGGSVRVATLLDAVEAMAPEMASLAGLVLDSNADLDRAGSTCESISAGFEFAGMQAVKGNPR
jgi:hypothetical protein